MFFYIDITSRFYNLIRLFQVRQNKLALLLLPNSETCINLEEFFQIVRINPHMKIMYHLYTFLHIKNRDDELDFLRNNMLRNN